jgi:hypothetical protein
MVLSKRKGPRRPLVKVGGVRSGRLSGNTESRPKWSGARLVYARLEPAHDLIERFVAYDGEHELFNRLLDVLRRVDRFQPLSSNSRSVRMRLVRLLPSMNPWLVATACIKAAAFRAIRRW